MNKIFKVIYSKTRHCYVVVSELAKSHCKTTQSHTVRSKTALTAAVLLALGAFSFVGMPVVQAADGTESLRNNDFVGANDYYWYYDEKEKDKDKKWKTYQYKATDIFNNRSRHDLPNYQGGGAKLPGAITAGLYAQAGQQTVTIGDRNAGQSKGSVFIGEHSGYNNGDNAPAGMKNNYVTSVGFQSDATGWGSIAIGSNAKAENSKMESQVVEEVGKANTSGTVSDDTYGIKENPTIQGASVALGYNAHSKDGNIAIGSYSDATSTDKNDSYVSVGNANLKLKRRITNVADGTETTDVATVGQMNKAIKSIGTTGWNLSTNGYSSSTTITSGKTVDFSPAVDGKNGTTDHKNVKISNDGSNVKIGLNKDIVLGEATKGEGGSLNVYSDSTEASNLGNRVSIDGSTVSVYYGSEEGASGTKRGVVLGVGEDWNRNAQGYIAFNNIDPNGKIDSTYLHSATDAPDNLKGRLVYSNTMSGTEYIANLDDGITFTGDVQKDVPKDYTQTPTKLNMTLNITGGAATEKDLTEGNIGVVSTPAAESADGTTQASKLEIKLNKDLKGITSITSQSTTNSTGAKIELGANGTTISGGDVNVSEHKVTGLANGDVSTTSTDAITGQQLNAVKTDLTKDLTVNAGWGLEKEGNTISLERNLGKNYGNTYGGKGKVTFEADGENSLIIGGGAINKIRDERDKNFTFGAHAKDSVLVGGMNNDIDKNSERALIVGGVNNKTLSTDKVQQTGTDAIIVGGADNKA
ncbi:ESPR-type extended signal peptide-containing protein [Megasphaera elsdenii]|uniref:Autotransporter adhesin n=1 Tax=Megasphaera elsdenii DSM 20460 TaxID=1064535 RepID=G0VPX8_MEGEL